MKFLVNVEGRCLEQLGTIEGDVVMINADLVPRAGDVVWCMIDGRDSLKEYVGCVNGIHAVTTRYEGRTMQTGVLLRSDEVRGVAEACFAPDGMMRWDRSERRPMHGETMRVFDCVPVRAGGDAV